MIIFQIDAVKVFQPAICSNSSAHLLLNCRPLKGCPHLFLYGTQGLPGTKHRNVAYLYFAVLPVIQINERADDNNGPHMGVGRPLHTSLQPHVRGGTAIFSSMVPTVTCRPPWMSTVDRVNWTIAKSGRGKPRWGRAACVWGASEGSRGSTIQRTRYVRVAACGRNGVSRVGWWRRFGRSTVVDVVCEFVSRRETCGGTKMCLRKNVPCAPPHFPFSFSFGVRGCMCVTL